MNHEQEQLMHSLKSISPETMAQWDDVPLSLFGKACKEILGVKDGDPRQIAHTNRAMIVYHKGMLDAMAMMSRDDGDEIHRNILENLLEFAKVYNQLVDGTGDFGSDIPLRPDEGTDVPDGTQIVRGDGHGGFVDNDGNPVMDVLGQLRDLVENPSKGDV